MKSARTGHAPALAARDWIVLALAAARNRALTPVQLQKDLFLLGARRTDDVGTEFYQFTAYHYGPFCSTVYADTERLEAEEMVEIDGSQGRSRREYRLTDLGIARAEELRGRAAAAALEYLQRVVPWSQQRSFAELVRAVYNAYPEMRKHSAFRDPSDQ